MPIALLPELTRALGRAGRALGPWSRMVTLEEQVLRRVRGAFLVHWFGTGLPVHGLSLHIAITNIDDLKRRYLEVRRSMPGAPPELNLLGPLAGLAGFLFGAAVSPTGVILLASHMHEIMDHLVGGAGGGILAMLYNVVGVAILPALGPALGLVALPLLLLGALGAAAGGDRLLRAVYLVLGETAVLLDAVLRFWDVVTGPRGEVRNPLLRRILDVLDRFAGLFVQVIGFTALLVTRVARLLPHVASQFRAFQNLAEAVVEALMGIFRDFGERLAAPFLGEPGILGVLDSVFETIVGFPERLVAEVSELIEDAAAEVMQVFGVISTRIGSFVGRLRERIVAAFEATAVGVLVERVMQLLQLLPEVRAAFVTAAGRRSGQTREEAEEEQRGFFRRWVGDPALWVITGGFTGSLANLLESFGDIPIPDFPELDVPDFPEGPALPGLDEIMERIGEPSGLDTDALTRSLEEDARTVLEAGRIPEELLQRPPSAFAGQRRELERSAGRPELQLDDERLRDLIYLAVGRVLPPALRLHAPAVREMFDRLDEEVYGLEREAPEHPMLDLGDSGRLRPVVEVLNLRSGGGFPSDLRAFRDLLVSEIEGRAYLAPASP